MSALVGGQVSANEDKKYVGDYCVNCFGSQKLLNAHVEYCRNYDAVNTILPEPGKNIFEV